MKTIQLVDGPYAGMMAEVPNVTRRISAPILDEPLALTRRRRKRIKAVGPTWRLVYWQQDPDQPDGDTPRRFLLVP